MANTLTTEQICDAVRQMTAHCKLLMSQYNAGVGEYATVSARSVLNELGFGEDADQILEAIGKAGFNYCLDHKIATHDGEFPVQSVCYWGADQLESRLHGIDWRIEHQANRA